MPLPVEREAWWRMPEAQPLPSAPRRPASLLRWCAPYWMGALALAYLIHVDVVPIRHAFAAWSAPDTEAPAMMGALPPAPEKKAAPLLALPEVEEELPPPEGVGRVERERDQDRDQDPGRDQDQDPGQDRDRDQDGADAVASTEAEPRSEPRSEEPRSEPTPVADSSPEPEPRAEPEPRSEPEPRPEPKPRKKKLKRSATATAGQSCEAAIASYRESLDTDAPPDITAGQYGAVLNRGSYFVRCGVPETTSIHICAAVQNGRAVGVTVRTSPGSKKLSRCVASAVRGLSFPSHPRMDVTRTTFE